MSSFNVTRFIVLCCTVITASVLLGACGYTPLYGHSPSSTDASTVKSLAGIEVKSIPNREGQLMRTALKHRLVVRPGEPARYALSVQLKETISELAIDTGAFGTRANLTLTATYQLTDYAQHTLMTKGSTQAVASYNILTSNFANYTARQDARDRAIQVLSDNILTRLAIYFDSDQPSSGPKP